jgi:hypothetical protein
MNTEQKIIKNKFIRSRRLGRLETAETQSALRAGRNPRPEKRHRVSRRLPVRTLAALHQDNRGPMHQRHRYRRYTIEAGV